MKKFWLIFAQTVTVALGVLFVVAIFRPQWINWRLGHGITIQEVSPNARVNVTDSFANAAAKATPSVVNVFTQKTVHAQRNPLLNDPFFRHFFGNHLDNRPREVSSLGSGVIVSPDGYIITNHHVVAGADEIQVAFSNGKSYPAKVVGSDPETDLAVLKINATGLPAITFGSSEKLRVGDWVLAIGDPFGVGQTVTLGIVSALGRSHLGINTFENFIQTDAAINPGNSGGALIDASGNLVGINTAIYSRTGGFQGIGFAIPESTVKKIMEQIIQHGKVTRGWIGVEVQDVSPQIAESFGLPNTSGAMVAGVLKNGPAYQAGIRPGDVLIAINGKQVTDSASLLNLIASLAPDSEAQLSVLRRGHPLHITLKVGMRPPQSPVTVRPDGEEN